MLQVQLYTKDNCPLCEEVHALLMMLKDEYSFHLEEIDIYEDDALLEKYQLLIPAVRIHDTFLDCEHINLQQLEYLLQ